MHSLVMRMRGGLGNQLFILGYGLYLKTISNSPVELIVDLREYEYYKTRKYGLDGLLISRTLGVYSEKKDVNSLKYDLFIKVLHLRIFLNSKFKKKDSRFVFCEKVLGVIYKTISVNLNDFAHDTVYMYGYFVDVNSLLKIRSILLKEFSLEDTSSLRDLLEITKDKRHKVAISLRLGSDYDKISWPKLGIDYYNKAIKTVKKEDTVFFVFSDEIEKAKEIIKNENAIFVENRTPVEQLYLMSKCDDFIISNSTFSWWGAFLGYRDDRIVCSPEFWTKGLTEDTQLYYENMKIIK